jgi:predicted transcriptional regulator
VNRTQMLELDSPTANRLRDLVVTVMREEGVTQAQVAAAIGTTQNALSRSLNHYFSLIRAEQILDALGLKLEFRIVRKDTGRHHHQGGS